MKKIFYAGTEFITGDDIAMGVLQYCAALAGSVTAEVMEIPVRRPDGTLDRVALLVGPTSQIVVANVDGDHDELIDLDVMRRLGERTRAQQPTADTQPPAADDVPPESQWPADY